ncbi:hypothetical protein PSHT_06400 [Puccinia striiformis]|uniref:Uncharacterized protein n=1 Tax=Puccinia striiformis TaxID=27350 RepID=A0A2S4W6R1_9BASI|nr:hypothetical protein PSHT_06400 [Puccinia striiformis]
MPSHLRNGRDLSGEQRRRDVEAGLSNIAGQRAVQRAQGKPSVPRTDANDQARNECRSNSDGGQLQGHVSCVKVGDVNPSSNTGGSFDRTTKGSVGDGEPGSNCRPGDYSSLESSSNLRQQTTGDVHKYVPLPVVHVRRSQENRRPSSHESRSESGDLEPGAHPTSPELRRDDGRVRELVSRSRDGHRVPQETSVQPIDFLGDSSLYLNSLPSEGTVLAPGRCCNDLPGSYPGASNGSTSLIDLISPPDYSQLGVRTGSKLRAESRSSSRPVRDEPVELCVPERDERPSPERRAERDERPCSELRAELRDAVSAKPQPVYVRAPQTPSTPAGLTRYFTPSGPHLQQPSKPPCSKGQVPLQPQRTSSTPASSSSAAARHPLPCSTPARWKLRGIQEEKEESPTGRQHGSSLGSGKCLLESRKDLREDAKSPGKSECSKQESPKSTSSPVDPYMNLSFNPALEQLSDASQKEFLLSNINNRLAHDNPFLIEDKLQKLFSTFLSDLSGTIDAFPSTVLESCVEKLSSTINSSILELIKSEITPILLDDTLHKLRELRREEKSSPDTCQTESLKDFINEKIDCLQDIIAINDGQQKTDIDIMRREFSQMEHRLFSNFSSITNQINDLSNNENDRFEQVKRRIGAVNNQIENLKSEVHTLTNDAHSKGRESPPS